MPPYIPFFSLSSVLVLPLGMVFFHNISSNKWVKKLTSYFKKVMKDEREVETLKEL